MFGEIKIDTSSRVNAITRIKSDNSTYYNYYEKTPGAEPPRKKSTKPFAYVLAKKIKKDK